MKRMRVLQSDSVKSAIKAKDMLQKASKRASETSEQTVHRQQRNREHMASMKLASKLCIDEKKTEIAKQA